jgi:hypothetical protein
LVIVGAILCGVLIPKWLFSIFRIINSKILLIYFHKNSQMSIRYLLINISAIAAGFAGGYFAT